jgi:tetratricopeptide (TPR) repeat protein
LAADFAHQAWDERHHRQDLGFAPDLLVVLAADLVRSASFGSAIDLLDRATTLIPDDSAALLALGATYERTGRYEEAVDPLRRLVREDPDNAEGKLRLAVNLARTGKTGQARVLFRKLIGSDAPTWVVIISYQEFARLLSVPAAEAVLREAVSRFQGNQALRVQLAFVLDRRGQTDEATGLIEDLARQAAAPETSPRVRYPAWPSLGLGKRMSVLESAMTLRLPALVMALDAWALRPGTEDAT